MEERFCSNCRAEVPPKAGTCPACGVFAGEVFDGTLPRKRSRGILWFVAVLVLGAAAFAAWKFLPALRGDSTPSRPPEVRVVGDRPGGARRGSGAKLSEAEAIRLLRRHIVTANEIGADCVVTMSGGFDKGAYVLTAVDRCGHTRLGRYRVDGKTGAVTR